MSGVALPAIFVHLANASEIWNTLVVAPVYTKLAPVPSFPAHGVAQPPAGAVDPADLISLLSLSVVFVAPSTRTVSSWSWLS